MEKVNIKEEIIKLLKSSRFGLNVKNLKDQLGYSRTTLAKYLKILEHEGLVFDREIGQYRVWLHKDTFLGKNDKSNTINSILFAIYCSMLKHMQIDSSLNLDFAKIKKLGKDIANDLSLSNFIDIIPLETQEMPQDLKSISNMLMKTIDSICNLYDTYHWRPPIIIEEQNIIIIRMYDSQLINLTHFHFYLLSGFIEHEMNKYTIGKVNVIQINEKEKIVDFQFEL